MRTLYIFRGSSASGKTTITPLFCELLPRPVALLEHDQWRWGVHLIGREPKDVDPGEHVLADELYLHTLEEYLKADRYNVVVEGSFGWGQPDYFTDVQRLKALADKYGYAVQSIVLKADKEILAARNEKRKYTVPAKEFDRIYELVYGTIDPSEHVIDSSDLQIKPTLTKLCELMGLDSSQIMDDSKLKKL